MLNTLSFSTRTTKLFNAILVDPYEAVIKEVLIPFCEDFDEINKILRCKRNFAYGLKAGNTYSLAMRVSDEPESESKGFVYCHSDISDAEFINGRALLIAYDQESGLETDLDAIYGDSINVERISGKNVEIFSPYPARSLAQAINDMECANFFSPDFFVAFSTPEEFGLLKDRLLDL